MLPTHLFPHQPDNNTTSDEIKSSLVVAIEINGNREVLAVRQEQCV